MLLLSSVTIENCLLAYMPGGIKTIVNALHLIRRVARFENANLKNNSAEIEF